MSLAEISKTESGGARFQVLIDGLPPFPGRGVTQVAVTSTDTAVLRFQPLKANGQPDGNFPPGPIAIGQPDAQGRVYFMALWSASGDGEATYSISAGNGGQGVVAGSGAFKVAGASGPPEITGASVLELVEG